MINFGAIKALGAVVFAVAYSLAVFAFGYETAERKLQTELQTQRTELQTQAREKEQENAKKLAEALAARDKALARAESVRRDAIRMREQSDSVAASLSTMSAADSGSGDGVRERLGRCESLLAESAGLLGESVDLAGEGAELSIRIAADKDAVVNSIQPIN